MDSSVVGHDGFNATAASIMAGIIVEESIPPPVENIITSPEDESPPYLIYLFVLPIAAMAGFSKGISGMGDGVLFSAG